MFNSENNVFKRTAADSAGPQLSANIYNLIIGLVLCWGFFVNWLIVTNIPIETVSKISPLLFILGYFASAFFGIFLFNKSDNPLISFIGYNFVVVPFGFVIHIIVAQFDPNLVINAMAVTGIVTAIMMILGTVYPAFFEKLAPALFIALIAVIIVEVLGMFFFRGVFRFTDWIVALIFCGYIGFDWSRANKIPKTLDNAVDSAAALYIDIINLFIRILSIMGRRR
jgi:FtsH-binding integral membrane protein